MSGQKRPGSLCASIACVRAKDPAHVPCQNDAPSDPVSAGGHQQAQGLASPAGHHSAKSANQEVTGKQTCALKSGRINMGRPTRPIPENYAEIRPTLHRNDAKEVFNARTALIRRWDDELGEQLQIARRKYLAASQKVRQRAWAKNYVLGKVLSSSKTIDKN